VMKQPHAKGAGDGVGLYASSFQSSLMHNPKAHRRRLRRAMAFG
jgi:hypothetical protein